LGRREISAFFSENYFSYVIRSKIKFDFFTNLEYNLITKEKEKKGSPKMEVIDERTTTNTTFEQLNRGAVFLCPVLYGEDVFIKTDVDVDYISNSHNPNEGWIAVDLRHGELVFFYNETEVLEVNATVTFR